MIRVTFIASSFHRRVRRRWVHGRLLVRGTMQRVGQNTACCKSEKPKQDQSDRQDSISDQGTVPWIELDKKVITVSTECSCGSDKLIELKFTLQDKTKLLLNRKEVKLTDLKVGDDVDIDFEDPTNNVLKVAARRAEENPKS